MLLKWSLHKIYEEIEKENKLPHSIITSNNKREHRCVPWPWDNIKVAKNMLAHPK